MTKPNRSAINRIGHHEARGIPIQVFWRSAATAKRMAARCEAAYCFHEATAILEGGEGWFWRLKGETDANGPFNTSDEAYDDAGGET